MTPDLTTEVIGYRQWYVTPDLKLRAAHKSKVLWKAGENVAECHPEAPGLSIYFGDEPPVYPPPCATVPGAEHDCGIYALHHPSDQWYGKKNHRSSGLFGRPETDVLVSGVVAAWGAMEVHHSGFRAERARIVALAVPDGKRDAVVARAVAQAYSVPCVSTRELPGIAAEFGTPVPVELRPEKVERVEWTHTFSLSSADFDKAMRGMQRASKSVHYFAGAWSVDPPKPTTPVERARAKRKFYDAYSYLPKRKGGFA